jgi:hypothetical protein
MCVAGGGDGSRDGPAVGTVGEYAGGRGAAGVPFLDDCRRVSTGPDPTGDGAVSSFNCACRVLSGISSGKTVTPVGGDGGGRDGSLTFSIFDDLIKVRDVSGT